MEEIEIGFNFLFSFYDKEQKSHVGAVVVLMLSGGEIETGSNGSSVNRVVCYSHGQIML